MNCTSTVDGTVICEDSRHYSKLNLLSLGVLCTVCIPEGKYCTLELKWQNLHSFHSASDIHWNLQTAHHSLHSTSWSQLFHALCQIDVWQWYCEVIDLFWTLNSFIFHWMSFNQIVLHQVYIEIKKYLGKLWTYGTW